MRWLQKITNPQAFEAYVKSQVLAAEIGAAGLPMNPDSRGVNDFFGPEYKGLITPDIAVRIYQVCPEVRSCIDLIAGYASTVPLKAYSKPTRKGDWVEDDRIIPGQMLKYINPKMTQAEYITRIISHLLLFENAYIAIEDAPPGDQDKSPFSLYPMNPVWTRLIPEPINGVKYYRYAVSGNDPVFFRYDKVLHIKGYSPLDDFYGLLKLNALSTDVEKSRNAAKFLSKFYGKAVNLSGVLELGELGAGSGPDELAKYKKQIEEQYQGGDNAFRVLVLEKGMKWNVPASNNVEVNTIPVLAHSRADIQMMFKVPPQMFSGDSRVPEAVEGTFWNMALLPDLNRVAQAHDKYLAKALDYHKYLIRFDLTEVIALKRQLFDLTRVNVADANTGIYTPNEIRVRDGHKPYDGENADWGDTPVPVSLAKLGAAGKPGGNPAQQGGTSPSLSMPGSQGGRDQSGHGEATLPDKSGMKSQSTIPDFPPLTLDNLRDSIAKSLELF